jgi:HEAT repeat protein
MNRSRHKRTEASAEHDQTRATRLCLWTAVIICLAAVATIGAMEAELSFLDQNAELKARLLRWEQESPEEVKREIAALRTGDSVAKAYAARSLAGQGPTAKGAILALLSALTDYGALKRVYSPPRPTVDYSRTSAANEAAKALARIGEPGVESVVAMLKDENRSFREAAAHALRTIKDKRAIKPLIAALKDEDQMVRQDAGYALDEIDPEWAKSEIAAETVPDFIAALEDRYLDLVAEFKAKHPDLERRLKNKDDFIVTGLKDKNSTTRNSAAKTLGQIKDARAVGPLLAVLKDKDSWVCTSVAEALGQIGDVRAVEPLIATLRDKHYPARSSAAAALGQIRDARAVEPLIGALKDRDSLVRFAAMRALGQIRDARAVEPLIATLTRGESSARSSAATALGSIGDQRAIEPLITTLKNCKERPELCRAAAESLKAMTGQDFGIDHARWVQWSKEKTTQEMRGKSGEH